MKDYQNEDSLNSEHESGECSENYDNNFVDFASHQSQLPIESNNTTPISCMMKFTSAGTC